MDTQTSEVRSGMSLDQEMMRPFVSGEEVEFFERVKKYIGSKATYNAFLKVLNLFSQQIVDQNVLVNRVEGFIGGNKDLFDMFKTLVGYDGKDEVVENVPADMDKPDLSRCRACGPSYRLIPKSVRYRISILLLFLLLCTIVFTYPPFFYVLSFARSGNKVKYALVKTNCVWKY